jgi:O-antigen ligase
MRRLRAELDLQELSRSLPAAGVLVVWGVLMFAAGGFRPAAWLPAGLVLLALLVLAWVGRGPLLPPPGNARNALLALAAFTALCFLSLAWSDAPGKTWEAANLMLVALAGIWTLTLAPWRTSAATVFMVAFSCLAVIACLAALLSAVEATDLTSRFEDFRFSPPLDYPNTTAAFGFMAALPALLLAARPDASVGAKTLGQGLATFLCAYALLPQSRGSILGGIAAVVVLAIAVPFRWRLTLHALLVAVAVVAVAGPVGDVYTAANTGHASGALRDAFTAILLAAFGGTLAGLGLALAEDRVEIDDHRARLARTGGIAVAALAAVAVLGTGVAKSSSISDTLSDQWRSLKHPGIRYGGERANEASGRLSSVDPLERYDYWRVALDGFRANPLLGMGAGGFEHRYERDRRYAKPSRYPHNLALKVLGDTGLVGLALIGAFVFFVGRGLLVRVDRLPLRVRAVMATATATLAYFVAHGLFDWLEAYPVLVGPALGFPLIALALREHAERERRRETPASPEKPLWARGAAGVGVILAAFSLLAPWLALRYRDRASDTWRTNPAIAYSDLNRAAALDPFGADAYVLQGVIAVTRGDTAKAQDGFRKAIGREDTWLPHLGLGAIAAEAGDRGTARREVARALALNGRDSVLPDVADQVLSRRGLAASAAVREALTNNYAAPEPVK